MLPSTNLVDLTVDDGYATADDDTIPSAPDAPHPGAPDDQHHGATPSDISDESFDGSTLLLPPKEPTTNDLLRALLTASSATNLLLTQLLSGDRPDNGRPKLVQPRRQPPAAEVPRNPDFFDDGRPRTSKRPIDLSLPIVDTTKLEPVLPRYSYNPPPIPTAADPDAPAPAVSEPTPDPRQPQRIRGHWIGAGSPRPSDFSEETDQHATPSGGQSDTTSTDSRRTPATPPDPAAKTAPSRKSPARSTARAPRRSSKHTPAASPGTTAPASAPADPSTPTAGAPTPATPATPSAGDKCNAPAAAESLPTPPAKDSLVDTYADIHAARRADMHAATAMYTHVNTLRADVAPGPYMLAKTTISSIRLFMKRLPEYTRLGGTLRWVHLLTRPIAAEIWNRREQTEH